MKMSAYQEKTRRVPFGKPCLFLKC